MWTLIIIALLTGQASSTGANGARSGASTAIASLDFKDQKSCTDAANALAAQVDTFPPSATATATAPGITAVGGIYRIIAKCVARPV
jgi:hypothetical protein